MKVEEPKGNNGRKKGDPLTRWHNIKDKSVRRMHDTAVKYVADLNKQCNFEDKSSRDKYPRLNYFLLTYDELIQRPVHSKPGKQKRPVATCTLPDDWDQKKLGKILLNFGTHLLFGATPDGFLCSAVPKDLYKFLFGTVLPTQQRKKKK